MRKLFGSIGLLLLCLIPAAHAAFPGTNGRIVFTQSVGPFARFEAPEVYLCSAEPNGAAPSRLPAPAVSWPAFSPAGASLAFMGGLGGAGTLYVSRPDGTAARSPRTTTAYPSWSADGANLYVSEQGDLFRIAVSIGAATRLTTSNDRSEHYGVQSPDGSRLAYVEQIAGVSQSTLFVADPDARSAQPLVSMALINDPDWSPNSTRIAFAAESGLWSIAADGTQLRQLRPTGRQPAYSPDGTRIAFVDEGDIWTMTADGSGAGRLLETPADERDPAWQPGPATVPAAGDANCAITGTSGDDLLLGTPGRDVFLDIGGDDTIRGLGGADVIVDGPGDDVIEGGEGGDVVQLGPGRNRVDGGAGDDALGTQLALPNVPQTILGGPGDDRIVGGTAGDRLGGNDGNDSITGQRGPDIIRGGPGNDRLQGNRGDDNVAGGLGNDVIYGGLISDRPLNYDGYDVLLGEGGNDRLAGGWQKDRLFGGPDADRVSGGPNADLLDGGPAADVLGGDAGDDLLLARDRTRDRVFGGPGFDRARLDGVDIRGVERLLP